MVDFVTGLQAAASGLSVLRELSKIDSEYDKAALKLKVAELSGALATVQITLAEAQIEAARKDAEITKLRDNFKRKEKMVEHYGYFYRRGVDGKPKGYPYCPRCLDKGVVMMVVETYKPGNPEQCPECKSEYQGVAVFPFD